MKPEKLIRQIKAHPDYHKAGMILCHNGVVRETSRAGEPVKGLSLTIDHERLTQIIEKYKQRPGIIEILVEIEEEGKKLAVGDDVMLIAVAGDIRENVIETLSGVLNEIKATVTGKTEFFI